MAAPQAPDEPWHILIADDQRLFADALRRFIDDEPDMLVVGVVASIGDLRVRLRGPAPHALLLDYRFADGDSLDVVPVISEHWPDTRLILLTGYVSTYTIDGGLAAGCDAVVAKTASAYDVIETMRKLLGSDGDRKVRAGTATAPQVSLSAREIQVLGLLAEGASSAMIAARLEISVTTVRNHIQSLLRKLGVASQLEAVVLGSRLGLVNVSGTSAADS